MFAWGHSSAGRAPALQAGGHRFDPDWLHQPADCTKFSSEHLACALLFKNPEVLFLTLSFQANVEFD
jgi:hypothetical protein